MAEYLNLLATFFLLCVLSLFFVKKFSSPAQDSPNLPPSPVALPIIGHLYLLLLAPCPHQALHKLCSRLGPLVRLWLGSSPFVVVSDAVTAREFLRTHELAVSDRPETKVVTCLTYGDAGFIFAPHGDYWRFIRKLSMLELLGGRTLERLRWIRRQEMQMLLKTLLDKAERREEVNVRRLLVRLTSNVVGRMVTSRRWSETDHETERLRELVANVSEVAGSFNVADFVWFCRDHDVQGLQKRAENVRRRFDETIEGILKEKEDCGRKEVLKGGGGDGDIGSTKDVVDMLLDMAKDEGSEMKLTRENIKAFLLDILAAGTDTTAITTEWALAELINHPAILHKARDEIDSAVGESRLVDESDVPKLPFLQAIVKETLRLHPAAPLVLRRASEHCRVMGYDIPANTGIFVNVWAIGRDPNQWEDPAEFRPERFLGEGRSAGVDVRGQHYQLLPFGSGRRGCPGASLALHVMQVTLGAMVQCFEWGLGEEGATVDMAESPGLTVGRKHPLVCTPALRLHPLRSLLDDGDG